MPAPHGQPAPDGEYRHLVGRPLDPEEAPAQPTLGEHPLQGPGRPSRREPAMPQRGGYAAGRDRLAEPHRLARYLPAAQPGPGQVVAPAPARQSGDNTEPAPAHRVELRA